MSDTLEETLPAHAPLGPSAAEGWSTCADYVNANRGLPDDSGEAAAEGTFAHMISDECLTHGFDAHDFIGARGRVNGFEFEWEDDDADLLQPGIDRVRELGGEFFGEHRVDVSEWTIPGQFGTLDRAVIVLIDGEWWIYIIDLKWGRAIRVSPIRNKQLVLYALGFWAMVRHRFPTPPRFKLIIDQPRCSGGGGEWDATLDELLEIGAWLKQRAELTRLPNPPRTASEKGCMWCKRRRAPGGCDTYEEFMLELIGTSFEDVDMDIMLDRTPALMAKLTPERRAYLIQHAGMIRKWLEGHEQGALADALQGNPVGGLKAVEGRKGADKWRDKDKAEAAVLPLLGDQTFTKKLKTPTQVGKMISPEDRAALADLIEVGVKKPTLAPLEDARPAIVSVEEKFDDENEE